MSVEVAANVPQLLEDKNKDLSKVTDNEVRKYIKTEITDREYRGTTPILLVFGAIHLSVIVAAFALYNEYNNLYLLVIASLIIGHSIYSLGNFGHHLSHRAVIKNRSITYLFELIFWPFAFTSPTIWNKTHTKLHHSYTNGEKDTFRYYSESEMNESRKFIHRYMTPSSKNIKAPIFLLTYLVYFFHYTVEALLGRFGKHSSLVSYLPSYSNVERMKILMESLLSITYYTVLYHFFEIPLLDFILIIVIAMCFGSSISSFYLFTQHSLYPLSNENNSLHNSTSLVLPKWIDFLHLNSSWHIEHHLFPAMSPIYYPKVGSMLSKKYGSLYDRRGWLTVWRCVLSNSSAKADIGWDS